MPQFIQQVVEDLRKSHSNFFDVTLILPGKRPMLFLKQEFQQQQQGFILPEMQSIEEFVASIAQLDILAGINLWFSAYYSYKKVIDKPDTFEEFIKWAPTILKDFEDIDLSMIPPKKILDYLISAERIAKWGEDELSIQKNELIQKHLTFWDIIARFYFQFREDLLAQGHAYAGLVYRIAAENLPQYIEQQPKKHFCFVGFNALTTAEQQLFFALEKEGIATIYWDADKYYLNDKNQEAGAFLRRYQPLVKNWKWTMDEFSKPKDITVVGVAKQVGQAKYVAGILKDLSEDEIKKTALILADESILPSILNSLPENITHLNISMGIPLKSIPLAQLFKSIFELQMNREKLGKGKTYYYKNVLQILENRTLSKFATESSRNLVHQIRTQNRIFNAPKSLTSALEDNVFQPLFKLPTTIADFLLIVRDWTDDLLQNPAMDSPLMKEYLFYFKKVFNQLHENLQTVDHIKDYRTLYVLYTKIMQAETVSFIGEPLKGLQLMGLLETRLLNFDRIIMTSVNDEILPLGRQNNSFIPYDIRREMGLNTFTENDAIYAYHFYRLMQRVKTAHLIYNTESDGLSSGEKSRFIAQIKFESQHDINEIFAAPTFDSTPQQNLSVQKTVRTMEKLHEWSQYGISPSSLSAYLRNPMDFYEQRIFGVDQVEEAEETISARTLGNIVHATLEELYTPCLQRILIAQDFEAMHKVKYEFLTKHFQLEYKEGKINEGPNYLIYKIAERILDGVLYKDQRTAEKNEMIIWSLESKHTIPFTLNNREAVKLKGVIDRVDSVNGQLRIIDYKTGYASDISVKTDDIYKVYEDSDKAKQLQLIFYAHLFYADPANADKEIELCIYPIKFPNKELIKLKVDKETILNSKIVADSTEHLANLIEEILNPAIPFTQPE